MWEVPRPGQPRSPEPYFPPAAPPVPAPEHLSQPPRVEPYLVAPPGWNAPEWDDNLPIFAPDQPPEAEDEPEPDLDDELPTSAPEVEEDEPTAESSVGTGSEVEEKPGPQHEVPDS